MLQLAQAQSFAALLHAHLWYLQAKVNQGQKTGNRRVEAGICPAYGPRRSEIAMSP